MEKTSSQATFSIYTRDCCNESAVRIDVRVEHVKEKHFSDSVLK